MNTTTSQLPGVGPASGRHARTRLQHPRLPLAPLMEFIGVSQVSAFARRAGVTRPTVYRWLRNGVNIWTADRLAVELAGEHPATVFGAMWFSAENFAVAS